MVFNECVFSIFSTSRSFNPSVGKLSMPVDDNSLKENEQSKLVIKSTIE